MSVEIILFIHVMVVHERRGRSTFLELYKLFITHIVHKENNRIANFILFKKSSVRCYEGRKTAGRYVQLIFFFFSNGRDRIRKVLGNDENSPLFQIFQGSNVLKTCFVFDKIQAHSKLYAQNINFDV